MEQNQNLLKVVNNIEDSRGFLVEIITGSWSQINLLFSKEGSLRGNHYHKKTIEFFYIIKGEVRVELTDIENMEATSFMAKKNDLFRIEKNTLHTLHFIKDTLIVSGYDNVFDENNPDLHRIEKNGYVDNAERN